ncbi:DEKNAAC103290 [Brettanomyces naardenensis]|uniref:DEKNAAC103290 n=1 Tax=Brettanomyces naardenensis TaxID=13370 RepID=A0A448YMV0_BRENA|nr:DEKNAAC103290 [Brettanomyces naardenensis]
MSLERLLANDKKTNILNEEELDQLQLRIEKLKAARDQLSADGVKEINEDIEHCQEKLEGHILGLAGFGYFKDFILYSEGSIRQNLESIGNKQGEEGLEKSLEDLVSSVISLSIQHGVTLPSPNLEKMKDFIGRVEWCRECIDKLVNGVSGGNSVSTVPKRKSSNKVTSTTPDNELRTALNDLQFAHVYLTRQYEDERSRYNKSLNQLRLKLSQSQELLSGSNEQLTNQTNQCLKLEMKLNEALNELREKKKELHGKNLEINLLKVDHIGGEEEEKGVERGWESPRGVSAPILRMEFKKLVEEMNEEFEKELDKERVERKRLEGLVKMYESGE